MRTLLKSILVRSPLFVKKTLLRARESYFSFMCLLKERREYPSLPPLSTKKRKVRNILIYHISGMYYAGTEKTLQLVANSLCENYNVFFMYSAKNFSQRQMDQMDKRITFIEFTYSSVDSFFPYFIHGMNPHIKEVVGKYDIDLLITADSGHSQYPFNTIRTIPIILINIFGSPSLQKNIISTVYISNEIMKYSERFTGPKRSNMWAHLAVTPSYDEKGDLQSRKSTVRSRLHIPEDAFVFGRIGRGSDSIFDPIGINAFQTIGRRYPEAHYLIMSPPPALKKIVEENTIPNVHYMTDKEDIWDFYLALDALAHFRLDGETFGLNIAEAMYVGNPVISHQSHIWNAHLEYLDPSFSRIAEKDNVAQYAAFMEDFIHMRREDPKGWEEMRHLAKDTARKLFSPERYGNLIRSIVESYNETLI